MEIRTEDIDAILSAVEWLVDGTLSKISIAKHGEVIFAAAWKDGRLAIDPDVMPTELAQALLKHDSLGSGAGPAEVDPAEEGIDRDEQQASPEETRPVPA